MVTNPIHDLCQVTGVSTILDDRLGLKEGRIDESRVTITVYRSNIVTKNV